ncbi:MAG: HAD family hydrolase [Planctomycetia bacterium]|nr:HAD family hydrolase [Planctomycetia bacterium]
MRQPFEIVNPKLRRGGYRAVVFDFDGTISLLREGWARIMAEMGRELLAEQKLNREPDEDLLAFFEREMLLLSGKPSIFQMRRLAEEVATRGGTPPVADKLLAEFLRRLLANIQSRIDDVTSGKCRPADWTVPGTHALLDELKRRGILLVLASGTDRAFVEHDLALLDLARYFGDRVHAPANNTPNFSKRDVIEGLIRDGIPGEQLLGFGDGYSETVEMKRIGGTAIGVASVEPPLDGVNAVKRAMLIELGADVIVPDYQDAGALVEWLGN